MVLRRAYLVDLVSEKRRLSRKVVASSMSICIAVFALWWWVFEGWWHSQGVAAGGCASWAWVEESVAWILEVAMQSGESGWTADMA